MIYVHEVGRWTRTAPGERDPRPADRAEVASHADPADAPRTAPLDPQQVVVPLAPVALLVGHEGLVAVPRGRGPMPVHRSDLEVLGLLAGPSCAADLADAAGVDVARVAAGLARLVLLGLATDRPEGSPHLLAPHRTVSEGRVGDSSAGLRPLREDRIPVLSAWPVGVGPPLGLGMVLSAAARFDGGRLLDTYELRAPRTHEEVRGLLADHEGPFVLLCSNYTWSTQQNVALSSELSVRPGALVVHGGPDTPGLAGEVGGFLARSGGRVAVRGEAEETLPELLGALADGWPGLDLSRLASVAGLSYLPDATGDPVRTPDRPRPTDLAAFGSPYLDGTLDATPEGFWTTQSGIVPIETNRGCPYGCTYCDWGSATRSRIRKFPMERVIDELRWCVDHGLDRMFIADANFGMLPRDVEIADEIVALKEQTGIPTLLAFTPAKSTVRHLVEIFDRFSKAGITPVATLSFQTRDQATLDVVDRSNIRTDKYDELLTEFRRLKLPIAADVLVGLPGSTVESLARDVQYCMDEEVQPRLWVLQMLPNAPMNDPAYRERFAIEVDDDGVVVASHSFTRADHVRMMQLRSAQRAFEHMGLLRHVLRHLQWDLEVPGSDVLLRIVEVTDRDPERYPLLRWVLDSFEVFFVPPVSWRLFYEEVRRFLGDELGVASTPALEAVLAVQEHLMPDRGRRFPDAIELDHDYVAYYRDATRRLLDGPSAEAEHRPLASYPPASFTVWGDPAGLGAGYRRLSEQRDSPLFPGEYWQIAHLELDSPLTRVMAENRATPGYHFHDVAPTTPVHAADEVGVAIGVPAAPAAPPPAGAASGALGPPPPSRTGGPRSWWRRLGRGRSAEPPR